MAIKMSTEIQEYFDIKDETQLKNVLIAIKQCIDELSRKAQSRQMENRTSFPTASDLEENESVSVVSGGLSYISTKINGVVKTWLVS